MPCSRKTFREWFPYSCSKTVQSEYCIYCIQCIWLDIFRVYIVILVQKSYSTVLVFCAVLVWVFSFWVPCCDVRCDFRIKTMFYSFLPPVVVGGLLSYLSYLCLFAYSGVQYTLCCVFLRLMYPMLAVSLD
jgi:hypothetical protein